MTRKPIDVQHGVRLRTPSGDVYSVTWHEVTHRMIVILDEVGDKRHSGALLVGAHLLELGGNHAETT